LGQGLGDVNHDIILIQTLIFQVENIHTMAELKLTGNCLKGSRALVTFSENFDESPHGLVIKELLSQVFNTPRYHPHSQPFIDHVLVFSYLDNKIWFRNYEINEESGALNEIGPRFVLNPIKIFEGSFEGRTLWENPEYRSPGYYRRLLNAMRSGKYEAGVEAKAKNRVHKRVISFPEDPAEKVFG
jgi:ribosome biogenesis protein BRX1